jgi:hypothetical protein
MTNTSKQAHGQFLTKKLRWLGLWMALSLTLLACNLSLPASNNGALPTATPTQVYVEANPEAVERAQENFNQALQESSADRLFEFRLSDEEITSLAAEGLSVRADIPFSNPQVWFSNERVNATASFEGGPVPMQAEVVASVQVVDGQVRVTLETARLGMLGFPAALSESLSDTLNETLNDLPGDLEIEAVEIREGEMVVTGRRLGP